MLDWFQRLMPHTLLFFPLFERHATTTTAAADALRQMLDGGERAAEHCRAVLRYEEEADATSGLLVAKNDAVARSIAELVFHLVQGFQPRGNSRE